VRKRGRSKKNEKNGRKKKIITSVFASFSSFFFSFFFSPSFPFLLLKMAVPEQQLTLEKVSGLRKERTGNGVLFFCGGRERLFL
jgi:hypothetical protein